MRPLTIRRGIALLPLPIALVLRLLASRSPERVERLFSRGLYPRVAAPVSRLMGLVPFPVIEPLLVLLAGLLLFWLARRRFFRVTAVLLLVPAIFLGGWGLNYLRLPLEDTLALEVAPSGAEALRALCDRLVSDANAAYGEPPEEILPLVPAAMDAAGAMWPIPAGGFAPPKAALLSPLLSRLMIEGIVSPFTLEALVNGGIPAMSLPFAACHEAAHIRGFAREEDANLVAYLACSGSDIAYFRYSGAISALQHALVALKSADADAYRACMEGLRPEIREDLAEHGAYWAQYARTKTAELSHSVNDAYLQAVSGGEQSLRSYGRLVDLLIALHQKEGF